MEKIWPLKQTYVSLGWFMIHAESRLFSKWNKNLLPQLKHLNFLSTRPTQSQGFTFQNFKPIKINIHYWLVCVVGQVDMFIFYNFTCCMSSFLIIISRKSQFNRYLFRCWAPGTSGASGCPGFGCRAAITECQIFGSRRGWTGWILAGPTDIIFASWFSGNLTNLKWLLLGLQSLGLIWPFPKLAISTFHFSLHFLNEVEWNSFNEVLKCTSIKKEATFLSFLRRIMKYFNVLQLHKLVSCSDVTHNEVFHNKNQFCTSTGMVVH